MCVRVKSHNNRPFFVSHSLLRHASLFYQQQQEESPDCDRASVGGKLRVFPEAHVTFAGKITNGGIYWGLAIGGALIPPICMGDHGTTHSQPCCYGWWGICCNEAFSRKKWKAVIYVLEALSGGGGGGGGGLVNQSVRWLVPIVQNLCPQHLFFFCLQKCQIKKPLKKSKQPSIHP